MSSTEVGSSDPVCNVCHDGPGDKICSKCGVRRYCSRECQKKDWKQHKKYCRKQPSKQERIASLSNPMIMDMLPGRHTFASICRSVGQDPNNPSDLDAIEDKITAILSADQEERGIGAGAHFPYFKEQDQWSFEDSLDEIKALPRSFSKCFVFSWTCMGQMDPDTGELRFTLTCGEMSTGLVRAMGSKSGYPVRDDLYQMIYGSMVKPVPESGEPEWPGSILIAHRWGEEVAEHVIDFMLRELDILGRFETKAEAVRSARQEGTDPDGYNFKE